ncbi:hypothetical protein HanPSC8_Chr10g0411991 [Helianthus annuus]|nr:hypothetical protein HanPSC8_Chr10g0411991 [Helianthus annuus]
MVIADLVEGLGLLEIKIGVLRTNRILTKDIFIYSFQNYGTEKREREDVWRLKLHILKRPRIKL